MKMQQLTEQLYIAPQIGPGDMADIAAAGVRAIMCNRPDGEGGDQPGFREIAAAAELAGLEAHDLPVTPGQASVQQGVEFDRLMQALPKPVLAYCRSGMRSATLWGLANAARLPPEQIVNRAATCGYDLNALVRRLAGSVDPYAVNDARHQIVIVGAGAAGIAVAVSLLAREPALDIAIIDPAEVHYYQPGWTLVGGGVFEPAQTARVMGALIPRGVRWIKAAVAGFVPEHNVVLLEGCRTVRYERLVVCPGLKLDWDGIAGLGDTLGRHGVTSNYRYDLASYTWELVRRFRGGQALFTQPPMPIKCAGAPQKAMYLSCDTWRRNGVLGQAKVRFMTAGAVLFGVADTAGWIDVDQATLRHKIHPNIFGPGDAVNAPNAKTAAAARKQAPVVAHNLLVDLGAEAREARYDGYGSCPLTVERGKIVLAEFTYGGKLAPSFPSWLLDGTRPSRLAWLLKERLLPPLYWQGMLKGREWMAQPELVG
ncbi:TIGR01244 family phosphatase [Duganella sp. HSC-15S17]|uniref:TIGR01244 family phosphatase n=1 Tax=Duganella violaceipulchra TaxID=2849652 RepID=A0AA41L2M9_9BURK|nr:TIGR01244 family phosphatase [Duganella violaceicalia]